MIESLEARFDFCEQIFYDFRLFVGDVVGFACESAVIVEFDVAIFVGNHPVCLGADGFSISSAEIAVSIVS